MTMTCDKLRQCLSKTTHPPYTLTNHSFITCGLDVPHFSIRSPFTHCGPTTDACRQHAGQTPCNVLLLQLLLLCSWWLEESSRCPQLGPTLTLTGISSCKPHTPATPSMTCRTSAATRARWLLLTSNRSSSCTCGQYKYDSGRSTGCTVKSSIIGL